MAAFLGFPISEESAAEGTMPGACSVSLQTGFPDHGFPELMQGIPASIRPAPVISHSDGGRNGQGRAPGRNPITLGVGKKVEKTLGEGPDGALGGERLGKGGLMRLAGWNH